MSGTPRRAGDAGPAGVSPPAGPPGPPDLTGPAGLRPSPSAGPLSPLTDPDVAFYTVGQAGELLGIPPATLRRFDAAGAVSPARSAGGQRRYSQRQLEHAGRLLELMEEGLPLAAASRVAGLEDLVAELRRQLE
jgi:MerR family transcriptional regulator, heat shock protein HspR